MAFTQQVQILAFTRSAVARYRALRGRHRRTGINDLRIAAIVLEHGGILVTRNTSDFRDIDGLRLEDWSQE